MPSHISILVLLAVVSTNVYGQDKWVWPKAKNQKILGYYPAAPKKIFYTDEFNTRVDREREPTTRKPLPGEIANDDIEDYPDKNERTTQKQNSPYFPGGGNPAYGGQYGGGFNQYPQYHNGGQSEAAYPGSPSILVGPGGPTGVIGRPQTAQYPNAYPGQTAYTGFPYYSGYNSLGQQHYPGQQQPAAYPDAHQQFAGGAAGQYPGYIPNYTEGYGFSNYAPQSLFGGYPGGYSPGYPGLQGGFDEHAAQPQRTSDNMKRNNKKIDDKVLKNIKNS